VIYWWQRSVAAAPANCRLEPEPELAPIRAEPSRIWSSRHFSRLPLSRLSCHFLCSCPILRAHPPLCLGCPVPLMPSLFSHSCTTSSPLESQKPSTELSDKFRCVSSRNSTCGVVTIPIKKDRLISIHIRASHRPMRRLLPLPQYQHSEKARLTTSVWENQLS